MSEVKIHKRNQHHRRSSLRWSLCGLAWCEKENSRWTWKNVTCKLCLRKRPQP